uniref:SOWAHA-C winged helix-turn-helix domain-containing protein n=1 Tax=Strigamia maritima TaxID=126957 RepID=T1J2A4_STRMM
MAAPTELSLESVRVFILQRGGQVTNQEIAKYFRHFLKDPKKPELKELFKDYVKVIAVVKKVNDEKVIKLRNDYSYAPLEPLSPVSRFGSETTNSSTEYLDNDVFYDPQPIGLPETPYVTRITQSQSSPDILLTNLKQEASEKLMVQPPPGDGADSYGPTAPPRKKSYKENKKPRAPAPPDQEDDNNIAEQAPRLSVKEQASKLNKIASESQINLKPHQGVTPKKNDKIKDDDETTSVSSAVDPRSREFFLKCAQGDYHALTRLLRDDPHLVKHKGKIQG